MFHQHPPAPNPLRWLLPSQVQGVVLVLLLSSAALGQPAEFVSEDRPSPASRQRGPTPGVKARSATAAVAPVVQTTGDPVVSHDDRGVDLIDPRLTRGVTVVASATVLSPPPPPPRPAPSPTVPPAAKAPAAVPPPGPAGVLLLPPPTDLRWPPVANDPAVGYESPTQNRSFRTPSPREIQVGRPAFGSAAPGSAAQSLAPQQSPPSGRIPQLEPAQLPGTPVRALEFPQRAVSRTAPPAQRASPVSEGEIARLTVRRQPLDSLVDPRLVEQAEQMHGDALAQDSAEALSGSGADAIARDLLPPLLPEEGSLQTLSGGLKAAPNFHQIELGGHQGEVCDFWSGCGRRRFELGLLFLQRSESEFLSLGQEVMDPATTPILVGELTTESIEFNLEAGLRVGLVQELDCGWSAEAVYYGLQEWGETARLVNSDGAGNIIGGGQTVFLFSPFFNGVLNTGLSGQFALSYTFAYESELHNLELNLRRQVYLSGTPVTGLVGFRYIHIDETASLIGREPNAAPLFDQIERTIASAHNHLVGFQLGVQTEASPSVGLTLGAEARVGTYLNFVDQRTTNSVDRGATGLPPLEPVVVNGDDLVLASHIEIGIFARKQLRNNLQLRLGYQAMLISSLALAPDQFSTLDSALLLGTRTAAGDRIVDDGDMILHGPSIVLEYTR